MFDDDFDNLVADGSLYDQFRTENDLAMQDREVQESLELIDLEVA